MTITRKITVATAALALAGNGSSVDDPRLPRGGERPGRLCADRAYLYRAPGRTFLGTAFRGQPLSIQRVSASGRWGHAVTDARDACWLAPDAHCR